MITMATHIWTHPVTRVCASTILGISIWFLLSLQYDHVGTIDVPVQIHGAAPSHVIAQEAVRLRLAGPWKSLYNFIEQAPLARVNIAAPQHGLHEIQLTAQQINLPPSLHLACHPTILLFVNPYN